MTLPLQLANSDVRNDFNREISAEHLISDILQTVFEFCLESERGFAFSNDPDYNPWQQAPFNISQVCRSWRKISLSHSILWSKFTISCEPSLPLSRNLHTGLALWLHRSGTNPLDFTYNLEKLQKGVTESDYENAIGLLMGSCDRWRTVDFNAPFELTLGGPYLLRVPQVEKLKLRAHRNVIVDLRYSKQLQDLSLDLCSSAAAAGPKHIIDGVFPNLRCCKLFIYPDNSGGWLRLRPCLQNIFSSSPLIDLNVAFGIGGTAPPLLESSVFLPHLLSFKIICTPSTAVSFLTAITTPKLQHLDIFIFGGEDHASYALMEFIERSRPPLNTLNIYDHQDNLQVSREIQILSPIPNLKKLRLDCKLPLSFIESLTFSKDPDIPCLCPSLEDIQLIQWEALDEGTSKALVNMVISRWRRADRTLKKIRVQKFEGEDNMKEIATCKSEGLVVVT